MVYQQPSLVHTQGFNPKDVTSQVILYNPLCLTLRMVIWHGKNHNLILQMQLGTNWHLRVYNVYDIWAK